MYTYDVKSLIKYMKSVRNYECFSDTYLAF